MTQKESDAGYGTVALTLVAGTMFRLVLTDESVPSAVAKLKFYYLGGSSTFSPKDGYTF